MGKNFYSHFSLSVSRRLYAALHGSPREKNPDESYCLERNHEFYCSIPDIEVTVTFIHKDKSGIVPPGVTTTLKEFYCACFVASSSYTVDNFDGFIDLALHLSGCSHFSYNEFVNSPTASVIGCCNHPVGSKGRFLFCNYIVFAHILEHVRRILSRPLLITSGYRCPRLNFAVGGVKKSYHVRYRAVDIAVNPSEAAALESLLVSRFKAREFIVGRDYLHIAF